MVAIKDSIPSTRIITEVTDVEHVIIEIKPCKNTSWLLVACYIPPQQPVNKYNRLLFSIDDVMSSGRKIDEVIVVGDFNLPGINWDDPSLSTNNPSSRAILSLMDLYQLSQVNRIFNQRNVILDLVLCSNDSTLVSMEEDYLLPVEERHHPPLSFSLSYSPSSKTQSLKCYYHDLKNCNQLNVHRALLSADLTSMLTNRDVDGAAEHFVSTVSDAVKTNSPVRRIGHSPFPRWFSSELKNLVIVKKTLHKQYKQFPTTSNYLRFSNARASCKIAVGRDQNMYIGRVEQSIPKNIRFFWSHVNSLKKSNSISTRIVHDGCIATEPLEMCELFKNYFSSVFISPIEAFSPSRYDFLGDRLSWSCTTEGVLEKLRRLDDSKGWGPDGIPPKVLKYSRSLLAEPICKLFNASLASGIFPEVLKSAYVVPIHKSGPIDVASNYRPISILSTLSKIFEDLFLDLIRHKVAGVICPQQHGFTSGRSTVSNLIVFQNKIQEAFVSNKQVDAIFLDFSKAFDSVDHALLLKKMELQGFDNTTLRWLASYLSNRRSSVRFASSISSEFISLSGVPQGSLLGPYLFSLFINDLPDAIGNRDSLMFADDVKVFSIISNEDDCLRLQSSLDYLNTWCLRNRMKLNTKKCQAITFHRSQSPLIYNYSILGERIIRVSTVRDLGILLTPSLNPESHIQSITRRANRTLGFILRNTKQFASTGVLKTLYCALVRQILEYGSSVWSPHQRYLCEEIESIQRRFVRIVGARIGFLYHEVPVEDLSRELGLQTLEKRRLIADLVFLHKVVNSVVDCPDILRLINFKTPSSTRSTDLFARQHHRTSYAAGSTVARLQRMGNGIPASVDFFRDNTGSFRRKVMRL